MHPSSRLRPLLALFALALVAPAASSQEVPFYRVFRGFRLPSIPPETFPADLATRFLPETPRAMVPHSLVGYVPAVKPADAPASLPDEVAIVVYGSGEAYEAGRQDPIRQAYGALHWEVFEHPKLGRTKSHTARPLGRGLEAEAPVDVMQAWPDWQAGQTFVFMGRRQPDVPADQFLARLTEHVVHVREAFGARGLDGYIVVANADSEIAWMHWESPEAAEAAFHTPAGKAVVVEAAAILETVMWSPATVFEGTLDHGQAVTLRFAPQFVRP